MKKVLALVLALVMILSLAACGSKKSTDGRNPAIVSFMEKSGDQVISAMESSFATSSGMTCTSDWEVEGDGLILSININELEDLSQDVKDQMQDAYDSLGDMFDGALETMQKDIPELDYCKVLVCEKDGDVIATILLD